MVDNIMMGHEWSFFFNNAGFGEVGITTKCLVYTLRFAKQGSLKYKFSYRSDDLIHENSSSIIVQLQTIAENRKLHVVHVVVSTCK